MLPRRRARFLPVLFPFSSRSSRPLVTVLAMLSLPPVPRLSHYLYISTVIFLRASVLPYNKIPLSRLSSRSLRRAAPSIPPRYTVCCRAVLARGDAWCILGVRKGRDGTTARVGGDGGRWAEENVGGLSNCKQQIPAGTGVHSTNGVYKHGADGREIRAGETRLMPPKYTIPTPPYICRSFPKTRRIGDIGAPAP